MVIRKREIAHTPNRIRDFVFYITKKIHFHITKKILTVSLFTLVI